MLLKIMNLISRNTINIFKNEILKIIIKIPVFFTDKIKLIKNLKKINN